MAYVPDPFNGTLPDDTVIAETAQAEFRALKNVFVGVLDRSEATVTINNSAVITSIYAFNVPANSMGTNKKLRLTIEGTLGNGTGADQTIGIGVSFGATGIIGAGWTIAAGGTTNTFKFVIELANANATNAQRTFGYFSIAAINSDTGAPKALIAGFPQLVRNVAAEDTTVIKALGVQIQLGVANPAFSFVKESAVLERM